MFATKKENFNTNNYAKLLIDARHIYNMKRKIILILGIILVLSMQIVFAQKQTETERQVSRIRSGVLRTSKLLSTFKKTTKMIDGVSLEGTEATFYRSTAGLKKIHAEMAGETYYAKADFYYTDNGKLAFIYYRFNRYDTQIGMTPPPKVVKVEEKRLYFRDEKLIKKIITITETGLSNKSKDTEKDILDLEGKFRKAFKN